MPHPTLVPAAKKENIFQLPKSRATKCKPSNNKHLAARCYLCNSSAGAAGRELLAISWNSDIIDKDFASSGIYSNKRPN
jgi:hypothetical protein